LEQWDAIKRVEKGHQNEGYLHGVGSGLPGLMRAQKLQKKAARVGFDWPEMGPVVGKVREELAEVEEAAEGGEEELDIGIAHCIDDNGERWPAVNTVFKNNENILRCVFLVHRQVADGKHPRKKL
jgi:hypothetical protein